MSGSAACPVSARVPPSCAGTEVVRAACAFDASGAATATSSEGPTIWTAMTASVSAANRGSICKHAGRLLMRIDGKAGRYLPPTWLSMTSVNCSKSNCTRTNGEKRPQQLRGYTAKYC